MRIGGLQLMMSVQEHGLGETLKWLDSDYCFHDVGENEGAIVGELGYVEPVPDRIRTLCLQILPILLVREWMGTFPIIKMEGDKFPTGTVGDQMTVAVG